MFCRHPSLRRATTAGALLLVVCGTAAFVRPTSPAGAHGLHFVSGHRDAVPGLDQGYVKLVTVAAGARSLDFAMWFDHDGKSTGSSSNGSYEFTTQGAHGRQVQLHCETPDGRSGTVTINGVVHDLANGALFLVSTTRGILRVRQLDEPMERFSVQGSAIASLAENHSQIREFFLGEG